ncbi:hypothetical protein [Georgenia sp. AZ-5]|uniref:hypothetical protein n=1 Tax=Georgenia sp. AZ-5 TaxID=3367526 RepID=UPI0037549555
MVLQHTRTETTGRDVQHCRGTYILHLDGSVECTDPGCETANEGHPLVTWCTDVEPACACG